MQENSNSPYASPEEMAARLNITLEEAQSIMKSWNHKQPSDPEEMLAQARNAAKHEHNMRGLNTDRREGRITEEEYQARAAQSAQETQTK
jgi:hypothetical protein